MARVVVTLGDLTKQINPAWNSQFLRCVREEVHELPGPRQETA
jgi:hypothetical protein